MLNNIPPGLQTYFLNETESDELPVIRQEGKSLFIPIFIREITRTDESGEKTAYRFFVVETEYKGQDITDYDKCIRQSYAAIREYLYGSPAVQADLNYHHQLTAHVLAVKNAIRKPGQTAAPEGIARWNQVKESFWGVIASVLESVHKTRADLPDYFNAEQMNAWASENNVPEEVRKIAAEAISVISLDMLHNSRNWAELFE